RWPCPRGARTTMRPSSRRRRRRPPTSASRRRSSAASRGSCAATTPSPSPRVARWPPPCCGTRCRSPRPGRRAPSAPRPQRPAATPAAADLGITAEVFRRQPGVLRSDHPFAFAARGPLAAALLRDPLPLPPHGPASPVGRLHELGGRILLLGVGHAANTTLHL